MLTYLRNDTLLTDFLNESCKNEHEQFILTELQSYVKKHQYFFLEIENQRSTRTRSEDIFSKEMVFNCLDKYVKELWNGILERLKYFDSDGTTAWSEAPAEGIFSILQNICDHKSSIKLSNLTKLYRILL